MNRIAANGVDFAYLQNGPQDGPLALCLHGFPDHAPTYESLLQELAGRGFNAVAPWMRGYSPTSIPADGRYQSAVLALDAIALADSLAGEQGAVIVGHDWGAFAAYLACIHRPSRFGRLVALAVPHTGAFAARFLSEFGQLQRSWYMFFFQLAGIAETAVQANDFALIDWLWREWSPGFEPAPEFMRRLKETLASPGTLEAVLGYYRALFHPLSQDPELADLQSSAFAPVPVPTLYLHGADDGVIASEMVRPEEIQPLFPAGVEIDIVPKSGHFLHLERSELLNPRIADFLAA